MYKRQFLNPKKGSAVMVAEVASAIPGKRHLHAELLLSDCSRQIVLDFSCNKRERKVRLNKILAMIGALSQMEQEIRNYEFGEGDSDYL